MPPSFLSCISLTMPRRIKFDDGITTEVEESTAMDDNFGGGSHAHAHIRRIIE